MAATQSTAMQIFRDVELPKMLPQFEAARPTALPAEWIARFQRTLMTTVQNNPKLLDANRASLWNAAMSCAVFGLEPDPALRQVALVPFKGKVQCVPMYPGYVKMAANAGWLIEAHAVRQADHFEYEFGSNQFVQHRPKMGAGLGNDNPVVAAYAFARRIDNPDGSLALEVMSTEQIIEIRNKSAGFKYDQSGSPWTTDFAPMARKTPIRSLAMHLPLEVQKMASMDLTHERTGKEIRAVRDVTGDVEIIEPGEDDGGSNS